MISEQQTPRPRPPARAQKPSFLANCYPPPSYDSILGSPIPVTVQLVGSSRVGSPAQDDLLKSREEISDLLLKADGIIKSREAELELTSALYKSLHQDNSVLKTKHNALLSRIPHGSSLSISSPRSATDLDVTPTPMSGLTPSKTKAARRISMTPTEIGELSDQNAQLLDQIETLERESQLADQASKRKLEKLQREIQSMREELEKTQEVLEEKEKTVVEFVNEEIKKQRLEKEERLYALRRRNNDGGDFVVADFAPPSWTPASSTHKPQTLDSDDPISSFTFPARKERKPSEYSLISQLLSKIRELEEANAEIAEQQQEATARMRFAQQGVGSMQRVYDYLNNKDDVELEIISTLDEDGPAITRQEEFEADDNTITFSNFRRSIDEEVFNPILDKPQATEGEKMRAGIRSNSPAWFQKARKPIMGLFDRFSSVSVPLSSSQNVGRSVSPKVFPDHSPAGSLSSSGEPKYFGRSLGSELGSEFGDDWNAEAGNHHIRTASLLSLTQYVGDLSGLPSAPAVERVKSSETESSNVGLQLELGTATRNEDLGLDLDFSRETSFSRAKRLSNVVNSRSDRWSNGRIRQSALLHPENIVAKGTQPPTLSNINSTFDAAVEKIAGKSAETVGEQEEPTAHQAQPYVERQGVVGFAVELWLWLQFGIVIVVFLWAMAKRGPRSVLQDVDHKARSRTL